MTKPKQTDVGETPTVQPLTGRNAEGHPYERLPTVQREIEAMLGLESEVLFAAADNLRDETLVYLIRERRRARDWSVASTLSEMLVDRCRLVLLSTLGKLPQDIRDEAIRTVVEQLFTRIVALDDARGDFCQVRFGLALKRLGTSEFKKCVLRIARQRVLDADGPDSRNAPFDPYQWPEHAVDFTDALNGLKQIKDERHRMAFVLHTMHEMPIESEDPKAATISRHFEKSPRTINNWLTQAEADLARWRREMS